MKFEPQTDEQIASSGLLPNGVYDFEIAGAKDKISSKGNEMIEVNLAVYDPDGSIRKIRDWIMPQMAKKFKHFHNATGMMAKYESGSLVASDVVGKVGKCMVITKPYTNKDGLEVFSNGIDDYVKQENLAPGEKPALPKEVDDDSIPF